RLAIGIVGIDHQPIVVAFGANSCSISSCFAANELERLVSPVMLLPGLLRLPTRPNSTGSDPTMKTTGILGVSFFKTKAAAVPPIVRMTDGPRPTISAASAGRSGSLLTQR